MSLNEYEVPAELGAYIIDIKNYEIKERIDSGGYSEEYKALDKSIGEMVVLKRILTKNSSKFKQSFIREVSIMASVEHPFLLELIGFSIKYPLTIVTKYYPNGSLYSYRQTQRGKIKLNNTQRTLIAMGIAHSMMYLHSLGIIHRDLKSLNILLDDQLLPKLCDFGIARYVSNNTELMTHQIGTSLWMAPEMFLNEGDYGPEVDVYSFSIILYELLTNEVPWLNLSRDMIVKKVFVEQRRPEIPRNTPSGLKSLIKMCWAQDPKSRPSFREIYEMFANGDVAFPDTDDRSVQKLSKYLQKVKIPRNPKFSDFQVKKSNRKKTIEYEEEATNDNNNRYNRNRSTKPVNSEQKYTENKIKNPRSNFNGYGESDEGEFMRNMIEYDNNSPFLDIDAISDPRSYSYRSELKKAARSLQKVQSRQFMNTISQLFKGNTRPAEMTALLQSLQQILQRKCHREMFIELDLHHQLPLENDELLDPCLDVLHVLFEKSPETFEESFTDTMSDLIPRNPTKSLILLSLMAKSFDSSTNSWEMLDLMIQKSTIFFKSSVGSELISTLFFLCYKYSDYRKSRLNYCISVFLKGLQSRDKNTVKQAYNALCHFFHKNIDLDYGLVIDHLSSDSLFPFCLQLLIRMKDFPCLPELISVLLDRATASIEATLVLLRICGIQEGAMAIMKKPKWITQDLPTPIDTLRLYLAVMTHSEIRPMLSRLPQTHQFFIKLCDENDNRVLTHLSLIIRKFKISKEIVASFSESGVFKAIFSAALDFGDDQSLHAAMMIIIKVGKVDFAPEYLMFSNKFKEVIRSDSSILGTAISAVTLLCKYPLCAKKFKELKIDNDFRKFMKDPDYKEYAETFFDYMDDDIY